MPFYLTYCHSVECGMLLVEWLSGNKQKAMEMRENFALLGIVRIPKHWNIKL